MKESAIYTKKSDNHNKENPSTLDRKEQIIAELAAVTSLTTETIRNKIKSTRA